MSNSSYRLTTITTPATKTHAAVVVVIDRDKANTRQVGAIVRTTLSNAILQDARIAPVFAGSNYPWGNWQ